jgi:hypothetical protein
MEFPSETPEYFSFGKILHSPERLERELQLVSTGLGLQSVPRLPWQDSRVYFPLSGPVYDLFNMPYYAKVSPDCQVQSVQCT